MKNISILSLLLLFNAILAVSKNDTKRSFVVVFPGVEISCKGTKYYPSGKKCLRLNTFQSDHCWNCMAFLSLALFISRS